MGARCGSSSYHPSGAWNFKFVRRFFGKFVHPLTHCNSSLIEYCNKLKSEAVTAADIKITVFWDVTPCSFIDTNSAEENAASVFRKVE